MIILQKHLAKHGQGCKQQNAPKTRHNVINNNINNNDDNNCENNIFI